MTTAAKPTATAMAAPAPTAGLWGRVLRSSAITVAGYGLSQLLRLASNLILTRLLYPEAFGMMALVSVFLTGLAMFSDIGLGPAIMGSKRGDDPAYLDTAWSIQILRGGLMWLAALGLAWPAAWFFGAPDLLAYLPVAAFGLVIAGFNPTRRETANRHMLAGRVTVIDLAAQTVGLVAGIALAFATQSIWALVISGLVANLAALLLLDLCLPGPRNRWHWDKEAAAELLHFGKWIFLATIMGFAVAQADKVILGRVLELRVFGQFNIAYFLAAFPLMVGGMVMWRVLIPVFRSAPPREDPANARRIRRLRACASGGLVALLAVVCAIGNLLVGLLYDDNYALAGGMVVLMAAAQVPAAILISCDQAALAAGDSRRFFIFTALRALAVTGCILAGWQAFGLIGALAGQGLGNLLAYPALAWLLRPHGAWDPKLDAALLAAGALSCGAGLWLNLGALRALAPL